MQPKVSIIVPCWGVEKYLDQCVESLVNQTLKDIEIILIDDVSPDRVPEMCDEWTKKDARIKVVHKPVNEGLGMGCNTGLDVATGEYVAFCDSDDWVDLKMYETMYDAAKKGHCDAVFTGLRRVDMAGVPFGDIAHPSTLLQYEDRDSILSLARNMIASQPSERRESQIQMSAKVVLYRRELLESKNLRFVSERMVMSEDLHFNLSVLVNAKKVSVLPYKFYNYRWNNASISKQIDAKKFDRFKNLYYYTKKECEELMIGGDVNLRIQRMFIGFIRDYICQIINSSMSLSERRKMVSRIVKDDIWKEIWNSYPIGLMPLPHRVFSFAMKNDWYIIMSSLAHLRGR